MAIFESLKRLMKARSINYRELASELEISEPTVKRIFSKKTLTVERLERICEVLNVSLLELAKLSAEDSETLPEELSEQQEAQLASSPKLAAYFYLLLNGWTPAAIEQEYEFTHREAEKFLLALDRVGLIELHARNRVKLKVARNVSWSTSGPLVAVYEKEALKEFLAGTFSQRDFLKLRTGELSDTSIRRLAAAQKNFILEFEKLARADMTLPKKETTSVGLMVASRPFVFTLFEKYKRPMGSVT